MFSPDHLHAQLLRLPAARRHWVAYSGGMDSHALLHARAALRDRLPGELGAVHVDHGLQPAAADWTGHCRAVCADLDVPLAVLRVDARPGRGESPEAAARRARYRALAAWLPEEAALLTAQHRDDQAETLLLQLLRGSGLHGLAAMPPASTLGAGRLLRPLLAVDRAGLRDYALRAGLHWVEDPSNTDTGLDRNFLRHVILPELRQRWPAATRTLARTAGHCAEAARLLDEMATADLAGMQEPAGGTLALAGLHALDPARRRNALRRWLHARCGSVPSTAVLERIQRDLLDSRPDAEPCVCWGRFELRRYRDRLHVLPRTDLPAPVRPLSWSLAGCLELPGDGGVLRAVPVTGRGVRAVAVSGPVEVAFRQGGERCRPAGRREHHALKKLFQERGVPPWERGRVPLIYIGGELAAVAGYWVCEPFHAAAGEAGIVIEWNGRPAPVGMPATDASREGGN